jgi:hypothetical protein
MPVALPRGQSHSLAASSVLANLLVRPALRNRRTCAGEVRVVVARFSESRMHKPFAGILCRSKARRARARSNPLGRALAPLHWYSAHGTKVSCRVSMLKESVIG